MGFPLYITCCFSLPAFNILSLCLVFVSLSNMCLGMFLLGFILYGTLCLLGFPDMEMETVNEVQEAQRVPYRINPRRNMPRHILIKLTGTKHKEKNIKSSKREATSNIKGNLICLTADLPAETLQARSEWQDTFKVLKEKNLQPRLLTQQRSDSKLMEKSKALQTSSS